MLSDPYERLADLAVREARAAATGDLDALEHLAGQWDDIVAALPPIPPTAAAAALERALAAQHAAAAALHGCLAQARADLARLDRHEAPVRAYGGPAPRLVDTAF